MGMLALPRAANRSSRSPQGTTDSNRQAASPTLGQVYPDWPLYRHAGRCDRLRVTVPPRWSLVRRSGPRHLLPPGHWPPRDQQAADARAGTAAAASPYAALGSARHRHFALRGMAGGASQIGQDRLQARGQTCCSLGKVIPHTLRHTAATWLMQRGVPIWQAAGYLGMSAEMVERTYGHHHPEYMRAAAQAITSKQSQNVSLVIPLVKQENESGKRQKG